MTKMEDERADGEAGPISTGDSYRELELYLEKVSEEFGEVFDGWLGGGSVVPPVPPLRTKRSRLLANLANAKAIPVATTTKPMREKPAPIEWSDTVMHDFDRLIAQELSQLELEVTSPHLVKRDAVTHVESVAPSCLVSPSAPDAHDGAPLQRIGVFNGSLLNRPKPDAGVKCDVNLNELPKSPETRSAFFDAFQTASQSFPNFPSGSLKRDGDACQDVDSGFECGLVTAGTQTSPAVSRSSSFTWRSDCSSFIRDGSSSTSPSPSSSPSVSPCPLDDSIDSSPESIRCANISGYFREKGRIKRKNTVVRTRPCVHGSGMGGCVQGADVWVRRESVHTQTAPHDATPLSENQDLPSFLSDGGSIDEPMPTGRPPVPRVGGSLPRPTRIPFYPSVTPELPSPTSASLKLVTSPAPAELSNKSSSAPVITKKPAGVADGGGLRHPRSQSERQVAELEAQEACCWLRAAGFPQYAQLFDDGQFPIDVAAVHKDHPFLDKDSLRSLYRRLHTLNRCARLKVEGHKCAVRESDEEEICALSDNWTFQPELRRWSRLYDSIPQPISPSHEPLRRGKSLPASRTAPATDPNFTRTGSERLKDGARALLRRMEGLKTRKRRKSLKAKPKIEPEVNHSDGSPQEDPSHSPPTTPSASQNTSTAPWASPAPKHHLSPILRRKPDQLQNDLSPTFSGREWPSPDLGSLPRRGWRSPILGTRSLPRPRQRVNRSPAFQRKRYGYIRESASPELTEDSSSTVHSHADSDHTDTDTYRSSLIRWHSFRRPVHASSDLSPQPIGGLSAGQLMVLRKLALLKLTACMEKHCPPLKSNWTWDLPTFIKKIKQPDYKARRVFGVPLTLIVQRSGQALPEPIQVALRWLRANALDQVGLFRKSGVRSRILALKVLTEELGAEVVYDGQQAYDVADMVKQYLRELPESLFTSKLTDTFLSIFQHVPKNERSQAVGLALLLLPDENREALQAVLEFLNLVAANSAVNQMTASNLAVCLAPSLFQLHSASPSPARANGPRRKKKIGVPDERELGENKAAHDCLLHLINNARGAFEVPHAILTSCRFSSLEASVPMTLSELDGQPKGWRGFMADSQHAFLKEIRERSRGWVASTSSEPETELFYKKVRDGHPLRLWKATTEVEAPPTEVLARVLRERHVWDTSVIQWRVVQRLDAQAEVFQFTCASMSPLPAKDYTVLRTWKCDLPRGACVVVETSVEVPESVVSPGAVRAVVLASRYLIQPCGAGRTRIILLTRVDTKGRSSEWYNKCYGVLCASQLANLRTSFLHNAQGPESKV